MEHLKAYIEPMKSFWTALFLVVGLVIGLIAESFITSVQCEYQEHFTAWNETYVCHVVAKRIE